MDYITIKNLKIFAHHGVFEQETEHPEIEDGEKIGRKEQLSELIQKKILKNKPLDQIADELEESPETIRPLYEKIRQEMQQ